MEEKVWSTIDVYLYVTENGMDWLAKKQILHYYKADILGIIESAFTVR